MLGHLHSTAVELGALQYSSRLATKCSQTQGSVSPWAQWYVFVNQQASKPASEKARNPESHSQVRTEATYRRLDAKALALDVRNAASVDDDVADVPLLVAAAQALD